ncbi:hypothetical protein K504DRAFT_81001 [Pleomassaria siparia CBS 279.74]|uniref:Uncharacterized protein n=1 Tax=Pleomassaria siparia CBS 279.74 TaxID=1314801 RepID=A0A6G1K0Q2_9PLEO|nr:hypothetical protein K504DRAFT_81001 [Pleomassaria siparia CBS 279.74]
MTSSSSKTLVNCPLDFLMFKTHQWFLDTSILPTPLPSIPSSPPKSPQLSFQTPSPVTFPLTLDGALLDIPHLPAIRAFGTIASALKVLDNFYDPFFLHVLPPTHLSSFPPNLHPTPAQLAIPHHPLLDTLPWPSVRQKLICLFALPSALRPPIAQEDDPSTNAQGKAVMQIIQDLDDYEHGVRVHGNSVNCGAPNELVEEAWEVGECFYKNWWWCLGGKVVEISNKRRGERGLGRLRIKK